MAYSSSRESFSFICPWFGGSDIYYNLLRPSDALLSRGFFPRLLHYCFNYSRTVFNRFLFLFILKPPFPEADTSKTLLLLQEVQAHCSHMQRHSLPLRNTVRGYIKPVGSSKSSRLTLAVPCIKSITKISISTPLTILACGTRLADQAGTRQAVTAARNGEVKVVITRARLARSSWY